MKKARKWAKNSEWAKIQNESGTIEYGHIISFFLIRISRGFQKSCSTLLKIKPINDKMKKKRKWAKNSEWAKNYLIVK